MDDEDFDPKEEKLLYNLIQKETGSERVLVTGYKSSKRPFYTMDRVDKHESCFCAAWKLRQADKESIIMKSK